MTAVPAYDRSPRRFSRRSLIWLLQLVGVASLIAGWQVIGSAQPRFFSSPPRMASELWNLIVERNLLGLTLNSLTSLAIGLVLSFAIGVTLGTLIGRYRVWRLALEPYMAAIYSVPRVAFIPMLVIWFGIDREFIVATVVVAATVQIAFATAGGIREVTREYSEIAIALQLTPRQTFLQVLVPGSIPFIATGMRLAVKRGLTAVIVGEFLIGVPGVGFALRTARVTLNADQLFAIAIFLMLLGIGTIGLIEAADHRAARWRPKAFDAS